MEVRPAATDPHAALTFQDGVDGRRFLLLLLRNYRQRHITGDAFQNDKAVFLAVTDAAAQIIGLVHGVARDLIALLRGDVEINRAARLRHLLGLAGKDDVLSVLQIGDDIPDASGHKEVSIVRGKVEGIGGFIHILAGSQDMLSGGQIGECSIHCPHPFAAANDQCGLMDLTRPDLVSLRHVDHLAVAGAGCGTNNLILIERQILFLLQHQMDVLRCPGIRKAVVQRKEGVVICRSVTGLHRNAVAVRKGGNTVQIRSSLPRGDLVFIVFDIDICSWHDFPELVFDRDIERHLNERVFLAVNAVFVKVVGYFQRSGNALLHHHRGQGDIAGDILNEHLARTAAIGDSRISLRGYCDIVDNVRLGIDRIDIDRAACSGNQCEIGLTPLYVLVLRQCNRISNVIHMNEQLHIAGDIRDRHLTGLPMVDSSCIPGAFHPNFINIITGRIFRLHRCTHNDRLCVCRLYGDFRRICPGCIFVGLAGCVAEADRVLLLRQHRGQLYLSGCVGDGDLPRPRVVDNRGVFRCHVVQCVPIVLQRKFKGLVLVSSDADRLCPAPAYLAVQCVQRDVVDLYLCQHRRDDHIAGQVAEGEGGICGIKGHLGVGRLDIHQLVVVINDLDRDIVSRLIFSDLAQGVAVVQLHLTVKAACQGDGVFLQLPGCCAKRHVACDVGHFHRPGRGAVLCDGHIGVGFRRDCHRLQHIAVYIIIVGNDPVGLTLPFYDLKGLIHSVLGVP